MERLSVIIACGGTWVEVSEPNGGFKMALLVSDGQKWDGWAWSYAMPSLGSEWRDGYATKVDAQEGAIAYGVAKVRERIEARKAKLTRDEAIKWTEPPTQTAALAKDIQWTDLRP